MEVVDVKER